MINILYKLLRKINQIKSLEFGDELKRQLLYTWFKVSILKKHDSKNSMVNILDYKVKFLDYTLFRYLFNEIFLSKEYYFKSTKDNPVIIDCGSNIGISVLYFKTLYPNASIIAFEPGEETYTCLQENIKINKLHSIEAHKVALSNVEGTMDFYYDEDDVGSLMMSSVEERMPKQKRTVSAVLLSSYINSEIDFLKMDIEGAEMDVIEELDTKNKLVFIKRMVIEYHHHINSGIDNLSKMLKILENNNFGYHIEAHLDSNLGVEQFQDIIIYAYKKN